MDCLSVEGYCCENAGQNCRKCAECGSEDDDDDDYDERVVDACVEEEVGVSRPRIRQLNPEFIMVGQCQPSKLK